MFIEVDNDHVGAFSGKGNGYGSSDAAVATRNDGDFILQFS
jgi:hypothetical protein